MSLANKRIVLGITGSIAAYKGAELVRQLRQAGAEVQVIMTESAIEFITPLTLQALSGRPVRRNFLDADSEAAMGHIELARWADVVLVAPASANFIARLVHGEADDLLSAVCLATAGRVAVAPAMNRQMWANAATQHNVSVLQQRGVLVFGPDAGDQACGDSGQGRLREPALLAEDVSGLFATAALEQLKVIVTAGPTHEAIDPVRYLTNHSSGKMGYAMAEAAVEAGADVTLISGPVALPCPERLTCVNVCSAAEMYEAVMAAVGDCDIFIATAAVADYRPAQPAGQKIKKHQQALTLVLEPTPDIVAAVAAREAAPFTVGFAAETEHVEEYALAKLRDKQLDIVAANDVSQTDLGFNSDDNALIVYWPGGQQVIARAAKRLVARQLITLIAERYYEKNPT